MLIGLHGKKQAGKDTVYHRVMARTGMASGIGAHVSRVAFADKMYEAAAQSLGIPVHVLRSLRLNPEATVEVYAAKVEALQRVSVRRYVQEFAQAHRRILGEDVWVDPVRPALRDHDRKIVCVTDVRMPNEAQAVADAGGHVVKVLGPPEVEQDGDDHVTERDLPPSLIDYTLDNTTRGDSFAALDRNVMDLLLRLLREERATRAYSRRFTT